MKADINAPVVDVDISAVDVDHDHVAFYIMVTTRVSGEVKRGLKASPGGICLSLNK